MKTLEDIEKLLHTTTQTQEGWSGFSSQGLFKFGLTDRHAILGIPVDANQEQIQQRYQQLAQILHPDTSQEPTQEGKERGAHILSNLVIPAYKQLSQDDTRGQYAGVLDRMVKHLAVAATKVLINSRFSQQLSVAGNNLENVYKSLLQQISSNQYRSLDKVGNELATLSELNMVYLIQKEKQSQAVKHHVIEQGSYTTTTTFNKNIAQKTGDNDKAASVSPGEPYIRRATVHMANNNFVKAIMELRDGLSVDPYNSSCHSLLGMAYLKENFTRMARIHLTKALELLPKEAENSKSKK